MITSCVVVSGLKELDIDLSGVKISSFYSTLHDG